MQKEKAVIGQASPGNLHESPVIFIAHMFEYAHGDNAIELPGYITINLTQNLNPFDNIFRCGNGPALFDE